MRSVARGPFRGLFEAVASQVAVFGARARLCISCGA
jgi:hypothetical protein